MRSQLLAPLGASIPQTRANVDAHTHLAARDLRKDFGEHVVLDGVSVTASRGDRLAVIGDNGIGKSTLLRILAGTLAPDAGEVVCTTTRTLVEQELEAPQGTTVGELLAAALAAADDAIAELDAATAGAGSDPDRYAAALERVEELGAWDAERRLETDLADFGADGHHPETPLAALSPGQRYRLRLACALHLPGGAVLLDEPSNHLDDIALDRLAARLKEHRGVVVVVTHDRWLLARVATAFLDLDPTTGGGAVRFSGTFEEFRRSRAAAMRGWRDAFHASLAEEERLERQLEVQQTDTPDAWRPEKGTGRHQRQSRAAAGGGIRALNRRLEEVRAERPAPPPKPLRFALPAFSQAQADAETVLLRAEAVGVTDRLEPIEGPPIELAAGGRLLVTGPNGGGKSTLLSVLSGHLRASTGRVRRHPSAKIGWLRQEDALDPAATPFSVLRGVRKRGTEEELVEAIRQTGLLLERDLRRPLGFLSVGQRRRVALAAILLAQPSVLLLDEPTNHLSVTLVDELGEALLDTPAAVVLVTHDRELLRAAADWRELRISA